MIVRFGGGNSGIAEYLEKGMKQGRMFSRDELDQRIILEGDLALTDRVINSIQDKGQERYLHITLSFREDEISNDTLQNIVEDYRELLMSAYADDEFNFYAEAHLPKIKQIKDERTGEMIDRKPHVHIVIPEVNLLTLNKLSPVGLVEKHERYLDSIQEFINHKYNLETPKDHVRNADMHHANVLSRIKGDFFGEKQQELKTLLVDEIAKGKINTLSEFQSRLSNFGEVKVRNKGKDNQYFAVKIEGDKKFTNLNHPIFKESFITDKTLPYTKPSIEKINADISDWKERVSREIKHVNFATQSFRKSYAAAEPSEKVRLLADREANYERKYRHNRDIHKGGRTRNYKSNLAYAQKRQSRAATREASRLSGLSYSRMVHRENQRGGSAESVLPENEHAHLRNRKPSNNSSLRRNDPSGTRTNERRRIADGKPPTSIRSFSQIAKGVPSKTYSKSLFDKNIEQRPFTTEFEKYQAKQPLKSSILPKFSDSNTLSFMAKTHQLEQERKAELAKFADIRKNIDPNAFLSHLERVYALDPKKHRVTYAKDGSPRFSVDKRNLNASDFLTKHLHLEWKEAREVLSYVYDRQANKNINQEKLTSLEIQRNIKSFTFEARQFEKDIKLALHNFNVDNRNLYRGEKKRIYSRFNSPKIRNQELAIASFRAMQRQERINAFEKFAMNTLEREKLSFQQSGYSNQALEDSTMAFKDSLNLALGNEFGRLAPADEKISFTDNFRQQQVLMQRQLQEQQKQADTSQQSEAPQQAFTNKALEEVMKLNNLGIAKKDNGDIEYKRLADGKTVCTDVGNQMMISKDMQSPENVKTFLELAIDKYGNELKVSGSREFKDMVVESAAAHNLPIILKPAALQEQLMERRKELQMEAKAESLDSITNEAGQQLKLNEQANQAEAPQAEAQQQAPEVQAEEPQSAKQHSEEKAAESEVLFSSGVKSDSDKYVKPQQENANNPTYDIKFTFDRKEAKYNVSINGESAKSAIAKDPNALSVLQQHPDIKKHNVPTAELQAGAINRTEAMKGGNRPKDIVMNTAGQEVAKVKDKSAGMER